jgi:lipoate-protein ligase A
MRSSYRSSDYEAARWRLMVAEVGDGASQLAVDEAILEAVAAGESLPTLRFYQWQPAGVSIGREQAWDLLDFEGCAERGWAVVRRQTEGRAILHLDELNYMVCLPAADGRVRGDTAESSQRLNEGVRAGLKLLGLDPARTRSYYQDHGEPGAAFFDGPAGGDITVAQNKLVASGQLRQGGAMMQQGSIILGGDITAISQALWVEQPGQRLAVALRMRYRAITLENSLGRRVEFGEAAAALRQGFAQALNVELVEGGLTEKETARVGELRATKYTIERWTKAV